MSEEKKENRGGARPGSGRKLLVGDKPLIGVTLKMSEEQRAKLARLGGAPWVRDRIDKAKEPKQ